jgi:putative ABC transport system permease protein
VSWPTRWSTRKRREERALAEELQQHLDERIDALVDQGMSQPEAQRLAHRELGSVLLIEERGRDVWRWTLIEETWSDLRYALRQLRRSPSFALATILTLALGIGANAAVFSIVNALLLRPLPFPESDRLVSVQSFDRRDGGHPTNLSYPTFFDYRSDNKVFEQIVCYRDEGFTLSGRGQAIEVSGEIVSADLFALLRVQPALGRGFLPAEEAHGTHVVVLSHTLWTTYFGADPAIVGTAITLDAEPYTVVGVAPPDFNFPLRRRQVQVWTTLARDAGPGTNQPVTEQRGARMLDGIARLAPGVSMPAAQAQLDTVAAALAARYPDDSGNIVRTYLTYEQDGLLGPARAPVLILFGAVALVLVIACANIANMLLARTADRERELGIRLAIGGSRGRVIRQLLTENLCLAVLGSLAGLAVAFGTLQVVRPIGALAIPLFAGVAIDGHVLAFSIALALLTTGLVSLPPAMRVFRMDADGSLRGRTRGATDEHDRLRGTLVVVQIAFGVVLSSAACLLVADFMRIVNRDLGFRPDHLLVFGVSLPGARYPTEGRVDFVNRLIERLQQAPGVTSAAAGMPLPITGESMNIGFDIAERPAPPSERPHSDVAIVTPGYFRTIGTPVLDGRAFDEHDDDGAPPVMIVNQAFADRFFPGARAVGKRLTPGASSNRGLQVREIIGIVGNARQSVSSPKPQPIYYLPFRQMGWGPPSIILRAAVPPLTLEPSIRQIVMELDKEVPIARTDTIDAILATRQAPPRLIVLLMGSFALIALLLTAVGLYGILAYAVLRRTREIGVRIALGATRARVVTMMLRRAMTLLAIGMPIGLAGAIVVGRLLTHVISDPASSTPLLLVPTCVLVAATAAMAAYLPARRAASIDPTRALRTE